MELSETALGHSKLSELLQDPRLEDICNVRLHGHGYVVVPLAPGCDQGGQVPAHLPAHERVRRLQQMQASQTFGRAPQVPLLVAEPCLQPKQMSAAVVGAMAVAAALAGSVQKEPARPLSVAGTASLTLRDRVKGITPLSMEDCDVHVACGSVRAEALPMLLGSNLTRNAFSHGRSPACVPAKLRSCSAHKNAGSAVSVRTASSEAGVSLPSTPAPVSSSMIPGTPSTPGFPCWRTLTPATLGNMGISVHNTFLHASLPPPTPPNSTGRSKSLPRNMGTCRDDEMKWYGSGNFGYFAGETDRSSRRSPRREDSTQALQQGMIVRLADLL